MSALWAGHVGCRMVADKTHKMVCIDLGWIFSCFLLVSGAVGSAANSQTGLGPVLLWRTVLQRA